ncbi:tyrosine-type recombinase/integrase [Oceanirhabdus seepicola]|uniref:Tyrosine-type recombinase/integrase n=1 Tax=Oceanirhabdus seepicola TaxID=2828781 RepID=A0A9J6P4Z7_9CLOT|nr:tyrosine-type recombinase/integrase [Oceanirhabdus seepicola]MCM1991161.1 tyrosine-type recombinase/integrase [Oceanirhabdus seepicola]
MIFYLLKNPCLGRKLVIPESATAEKKVVSVFTEEDIAAIRKHSKGTRLECILLMALGTGMRQGELLGLKWKDIDYDLQELKVERTLKYINVINEDRSRDFKCVIQPPKSKTSERTIPILDP